MSTLKQVVESLNKQHDSNLFRLTETAAKRDAERADGACVVRFRPTTNWCDFTSHRVELFEAIPRGWPIADVARRVGGRECDVAIVAYRNRGRWVSSDE